MRERASPTRILLNFVIKLGGLPSRIHLCTLALRNTLTTWSLKKLKLLDLKNGKRLTMDRRQQLLEKEAKKLQSQIRDHEQIVGDTQRHLAKLQKQKQQVDSQL